MSPQTVRLVALAMGDVVNDMHDWKFFGSAENLARKVGVHRDTVRLTIRHLERVGVVRTVAARKGRPTEYQWQWGVAEPSATLFAEPSAGYPAEPSATTPRSHPRRTEEQQNIEQKAPAPAGGVALPIELTVNQRAQRMQLKFWEWVKNANNGRPPASVNPVGFQRLMAKFITAGWTEVEIGSAVKELWTNARPVIASTIEAEMQGRRRTFGRPTVDDQLDAQAFEYDEHGNLK